MVFACMSGIGIASGHLKKRSIGRLSLNIKKWSVRKADRPIVDACKKEVEKFPRLVGLLVDTPKPVIRTTNDGNTTTTFFRNPVIASLITANHRKYDAHAFSFKHFITRLRKITRKKKESLPKEVIILMLKAPQDVAPDRISSQSSRHCWRSLLPQASALIKRDFECALGIKQTKQLPHAAKVDLTRIRPSWCCRQMRDSSVKTTYFHSATHILLSLHHRQRRRLWFCVKGRPSNERLADRQLCCKRRRMVRADTE
ncbi:hypothetical protein TNCV_1402931 [Trichonephila clavipes]|nr:hypothetical protein TNCV_1402931 [Trichonephila clavipes]